MKKKKKKCNRQAHQEKKAQYTENKNPWIFQKKKKLIGIRLISASPTNPFIPQPTLQILTKNPILLRQIPNHQ